MLRTVILFALAVSALALAGARSPTLADHGIVAGVDADTTGNVAGSLGAVDACRSVAVGEQFSVDVFVQGVTDFIGGGVDFYYDPGVLEVVSVTGNMGWVPGGAGAWSLWDAAPDRDARSNLNLLYLNSGGASGGGTMFRVALSAVQPGASPLALWYVILGNSAGEIIAPDNSGFLTVSNVDESPAVIYVDGDCPPSSGDSDRDGVADAGDNCPAIPNPDQADRDFDGAGNWCDDGDADLVLDVVDNCPATDSWYANIADIDGDGWGDICDLDMDGDGVLNGPDNAPMSHNPDQADTDGDGVPDVLDIDADGDGMPDKTPTVVSLSVDLNGNGSPETVTKTYVTFAGAGGELDLDADGDIDQVPIRVAGMSGSMDAVDLDGDGEMEVVIKDPGQAPGVAQPYDMNGSDPDGDIDVLVLGGGPLGRLTPQPVDLDSDGEQESLVWEPGVAAGTSVDADADGDGDADVRWANVQTAGMDNCPDLANGEQSNADGDAMGDACDPDDDNDLFPDSVAEAGRGAESFLGTDPADACADTTTPNDERGPAFGEPLSPWPVDINDDHKAGLTDILLYIPRFNATAPGPPYSARFDLNADGKDGLQDIMMFIPFYNQTCAP